MAIEVSQAWKDAIQSQFRYPAYIRMTLNITPPGMREGTIIQTPDTESITSTDTIKDNTVQQSEPVATFELNRWIGDGSMYLPSTDVSLNPHMEWWSSEPVVSSKPKLTFTFDKPYSIPGMYCVWDTETNSYPTNLILKGYNDSGTLVQSYNITSISSNEGYFDAAFENITKIELYIQEWSNNFWRARIEEIVFGVYLNFDNAKISQADFATSCSLIAQDLPVMQMSVDLTNYDKEFDPTLVSGYAKYLSERQMISISWGFSTDAHTVEWMNPWPMFLKSWTIPSDTPEVKLSTTDRLSFLTNNYRKGVYTGDIRSLKDVMLDVLNDSNIIKEHIGDTPWELDSVLDKLYTRAPAPVQAYNSLVQLLAGAGGCFLDINPRNNYIRVRKATTPTDYDISTAQQLGDPAISIEQNLKSVSVQLYSYSRRLTPEQVCTLEYIVDGTQTFEVDLNGIVMDPFTEVTGATLVSATYYARSATLTLSTTTPSKVTVVISGYIVEESTALISFYNNPNVTQGLEVTIDNPFITEPKTLIAAATAVRDYYLKRKTVQAPYLGYPELELGDAVDMTTTYGKFSGGLTSLKLTFNGGFNGTAEMLAEEEEII